jgi:hypothetical protein
VVVLARTIAAPIARSRFEVRAVVPMARLRSRACRHLVEPRQTDLRVRAPRPGASGRDWTCHGLVAAGDPSCGVTPPELPSGTVTFLFTEIEGSTRLLHELGAEAYAEALAEHRRLLRSAFALHIGGEVPVVSTVVVENLRPLSHEPSLRGSRGNLAVQARLRLCWRTTAARLDG